MPPRGASFVWNILFITHHNLRLIQALPINSKHTMSCDNNTDNNNDDVIAINESYTHTSFTATKQLKCPLRMGKYFQEGWDAFKEKGKLKESERCYSPSVYIVHSNSHIIYAI